MEARTVLQGLVFWIGCSCRSHRNPGKTCLRKPAASEHSLYLCRRPELSVRELLRLPPAVVGQHAEPGSLGSRGSSVRICLRGLLVCTQPRHALNGPSTSCHQRLSPGAKGIGSGSLPFLASQTEGIGLPDGFHRQVARRRI